MRITLSGLAAMGLILLFFIRGLYRGVVREILSLLGLVIIMASVWYVTPHVSVFMKENTRLYPFLREGCERVVEKAAEGLGNTASDALGDGGLVQELQVPEAVRQQLITRGTEEVMGADYQTYVTNFLADKVYGAACILISWLLGSLVVGILSSLLGGIAKLPGIREVNSLAGGALGAIKGALVVWLCLLILTVAWGTDWGQKGLSMASEDTFLRFMMDKTIVPLDSLGIDLTGKGE